MPVYTYRCENCGVQFERHQSFTDKPLKTCPECKKKALRKVITPTKVIFKGSGFYINDNKSSSSTSSSKPKKAASKEKETTSSSDSKPETKKTTTEKSE